MFWENLEHREPPDKIRHHVAGLFRDEILNRVPTTKDFPQEKRKEIYEMLDIAGQENAPDDATKARDAAKAMDTVTKLIRRMNLISRGRYNEIVNEGIRLSRGHTIH